MKIQVRFEEGTQGAEAEVFLKSLGLDPQRWLEEQTLDTEGRGPAEIFGMPLPLDAAELAGAETWICSIYEQEGSLRFGIGGQLIAAKIFGDYDLHDAVLALPNKLMRLSLTQLTLTNVDVFFEKLRNLTALNLSRCQSLTEVSGLSGLSQLTFLDLHRCKRLTDVSGLSGLSQLTTLKLNECESLTDVSGLSELSQLTYLNLSRCFKLSDFSCLLGLRNLTTLHLNWCKSLTDIGCLSGLRNLTTLNLGWCDNLTNLSGLSELSQLTTLDLSRCELLIDMSDLLGLSELSKLDLSYCKSLTNVSVLSGLSQLTTLNLNSCKSLADLSGLSGLSQLTALNFWRCESLRDVSGLSGLSNLTTLNLSQCESLTDVSGLSGLSNLTTLDLSDCESLTDVSGLSGLSNLTTLDLSDCESLTDVSGLSGLSNLTTLNLNRCTSLTDLSGLSGLSQLTTLTLSSCESFNDVSCLSRLGQLTNLDLSYCEKITSIENLLSLSRLSELKIQGLSRLRSIESLRDLTALRDLSGFHPAVVAELLAHTAAIRSDKDHISAKSGDWLQEAIVFTDVDRPEQDRFATTLGEAFSLLGKHAIELSYEDYLQSKPDFSSAPWKAWLEGTRQQSGSELMRRRIERQDISLSMPGCIGGICAVMPDQSSSVEDQAWGRHWLAAMESAWQSRAKELLPVSAEVCLAYARLGLKQALDCWLERFTDPSDPAALDPVQAALGQWQLDHAQIESAIKHAAAVQQPATRDPLLAAIVEASYLQAASRAGEVLLMIESEALRGELAVRLVQEAAFAASAVNMERLIVACGHSVESLARLVAHAAPEADAAHLEALSEKLKQSPQAAKDLQRTLSLKLLTELSI
jgi:Leucine-rich repeat (LRR) protein